MEKEFVNYNQALKLKELGFDEPCLKTMLDFDITYESDVKIPLYQQAFRWFREKYSLCIVIKPIDDKKLELGYNLTKNGLIMGAYTTYEKAEQACLDKLIEIVEAK